MKRWILLFLCLAGCVIFVTLGLLMPAHLQAVDETVLARAGAKSTSLVEHGLSLANEGNHGAASIVLQAAVNAGTTNTEVLRQAVGNLGFRKPRLVAWGIADSRLEALFWADPKLTNAVSQPLAEIVLRLENRGKVLSYLRVSPRTSVQELLRTRSLTNTVLFPPSTSASGQAYDASVSICGMLLDRAQLPTKLSEAIHRAAIEANRGTPEKLETALMDLLALSQRLNFGQLVAFLAPVDDLPTLHRLAGLSRTWEADLASLFSAVTLTQMPAQAAAYALKHDVSARTDFRRVLALNSGAAKELFERNKRLYRPKLQRWAFQLESLRGLVFEGAEYAWLLPWVALSAKFFFYLAGGVLLALAIRLAFAPPVASIPGAASGFHPAREVLFGAGFLLLIILLNEPFLTHSSPKPEVQIRLRLPSAASIAPAAKPMIHSLMMTQSLLTLLLFFVLQALLYAASIVKLGDIRKHPIGPGIRLKLLDNEEHLFDAGLYLGFAGTIISLILVSMAVAAPSLMAAYSSTSFGIIFVSIFKIFHLRPVRRHLLLEAAAAERTVPEHESWATQP